MKQPEKESSSEESRMRGLSDRSDAWLRLIQGTVLRIDPRIYWIT